MGGRGTFSVGKNPGFAYESIDDINGIKIVVPKNSVVALKLPEESHSPNTAYVIFDKDGVFHQYREYNENHLVSLEIGYHHEPSLGRGDVLHIHEYKIPGVDYHRQATKRLLTPEDSLYKKYKFLFKGVKI